MVSYRLKSYYRVSLIAAQTLCVGSLAAFDQGSYHIINVTGSEQSVEIAGRITVSESTLVNSESDHKAPATSTDKQSEFVADYNKTNFGLNTAKKNETKDSLTGKSTSAFDPTPSSFSTSTSVFGD